MNPALANLVLGFTFCFASLNVNSQLIFTGTDLNINNVRARVNNHCGEFWDPNNNTTGIYEVPIGSGKNTIYAGGLWIGGYDLTNQLNVSAQNYNQMGKTSFWPGPLDVNNGTAADPNLWNLIWKVDRATILNHISNWNTLGYIIPASIADWPGNAPQGFNFSPILAPFQDANNNQLYEPALGEFPVIYGDEAVYFICNDNYASSPFGTPNMKIEIHGMAWGFNDPSTPSLYNTVFMRYEIYNLSGNAFNDIALGLWTDADIGDPSDDYLATDIGRNMIIFYNGDNFDGGAMGYGNNPPAQGVMMLNKTITSSVFYENTNGTYNGNPLVADDYYKYMTATLLNGAAMPTAFAFPVDTITISPPWNGGLQPADLRGVLSTDTIIFPANSVITLDAAYITALPDTPAGAWDAVVLLQQYADTIGLRYASGVLTSVEENIAQQKGVISIYPNPMNDVAQMSFNNMKDENGVLIITSIDGKIILEQAISTASPVMIKKSELAAGLYIVSARFKNQTLYSKLIIR